MTVLALGVPESFVGERVWVALKERFDAGPGKLGLVGFSGTLRSINTHALLVASTEPSFLGPPGEVWIQADYVAAVTRVSAIERPPTKLVLS